MLIESTYQQKRAIVFAYHSVGVRCIKALIARGVDIALVVTHEDNPSETIWFDSVAELCQEHGIPAITPIDPNSPELFAAVTAIAPDFIFSFYYRHMLPAKVLALAKHGAYNVHGSLLPKYRGRVPVNWAVLHGESETGATLHEMAEKPDAGAIVAQAAVPILPDDTAFEVFGKLTVIAEQILWFALPDLLNGTARLLENDVSKGSYFGGRKPEDGRINWALPAQQVYNLHRAVAPPYPGAFTEIAGKTYVIGKARLLHDAVPGLPQGLSVVDNVILGVCGDGHALHIIELLLDGSAIAAASLKNQLPSSNLS